MMFKNKDGFSPLDIAVANNATKSIGLLLELCGKYYENPHFNFMIDE